MPLVAKGKELMGRWTQEEHDRFLKGLEEHGRNWKAVAEVVGTRTVMQVRTHSQKYDSLTKSGKKMTAFASEQPLTRTEMEVKRASGPKKPKVDPLQQQIAEQQRLLQLQRQNVAMLQAQASVPLLDSDVVINENANNLLTHPTDRPSNQKLRAILMANLFFWNSLPSSLQWPWIQRLAQYLQEQQGMRLVTLVEENKCVPTGPIYLSRVLADDASKALVLQEQGPALAGGQAFPGTCIALVQGTWQTLNEAQLKGLCEQSGAQWLIRLPADLNVPVEDGKPAAKETAPPKKKETTKKSEPKKKEAAKKAEPKKKTAAPKKETPKKKAEPKKKETPKKKEPKKVEKKAAPKKETTKKKAEPKKKAPAKKGPPKKTAAAKKAPPKRAAAPSPKARRTKRQRM